MLQVIEQIRHSAVQIAIVIDEFGAIEGVVTPTDILEAIVGELPDQHEEALDPRDQPDGSWLVDAAVDIRRLSQVLGVDLVDEEDRFATLAGYLLERIGRLPQPGERIDVDGLSFEVLSVGARRIEQVRITRAADGVKAEDASAVAASA
ncbi:MAG: transporter associated domain-containing protein [Allosphingosinicella sp.]